MGKREEIEDLQARVGVLMREMKQHEAYILQLRERVKIPQYVISEVDPDSATQVAKTKGLNFLEACKLMREGKKVARATMVKGEFFVTNKIGTICYTLRDGQLMPSIGFCLETVLATDWEVYEDGV